MILLTLRINNEIFCISYLPWCHNGWACNNLSGGYWHVLIQKDVIFALYRWDLFVTNIIVAKFHWRLLKMFQSKKAKSCPMVFVMHRNSVLVQTCHMIHGVHTC